MSNPCTDKLTDIEYLEHMIPHHQVAIDMSKLLINKTKNPDILRLCREIIRIQEYEIYAMTIMKNDISETMYDNLPSNKQPVVTNLDIFNPILSKPKTGGCDPLFFKPDDHAKHFEHMEINDKSYLDHMIPHHQVAIDMSRRLLLYTNHSYLMSFCNDLILNQQYEIYYMNNLLLNKYNHTSKLI